MNIITTIAHHLNNHGHTATIINNNSLHLHYPIIYIQPTTIININDTTLQISELIDEELERTTTTAKLDLNNPNTDPLQWIIDQLTQTRKRPAKPDKASRH